MFFRILQLFEIIVEFPESLPAIEDLKVNPESFLVRFQCMFVAKLSNTFLMNILI